MSGTILQQYIEKMNIPEAKHPVWMMNCSWYRSCRDGKRLMRPFSLYRSFIFGGFALSPEGLSDTVTSGFHLRPDLILSNWVFAISDNFTLRVLKIEAEWAKTKIYLLKFNNRSKSLSLAWISVLFRKVSPNIILSSVKHVCFCLCQSGLLSGTFTFSFAMLVHASIKLTHWI